MPLLPWARFLRLPNVFTAFADIAMAGLAVGGSPGISLGLLAASGCLYLAGMAFNDLFDRHDDARSQPFRPIPSGQIATSAAWRVAVGLLVVGLLVAAAVTWFRQSFGTWPDALSIAGLLAVAILLYDAWLKHTPAGPLGMGLCRFLNVLLGLTAGEIAANVGLHLAATVGLYIVGVTWFSRTEEASSRRGPLISATVVMLAAGLLALAVPLQRPGVSPAYPYLLTAVGVFVAGPIAAALAKPSSANVRAAVKRCIFGLVLLDAVLATAFVGWWGLPIALLLVPAVVIGKRVYST
jgi:4-hydroxybenzoate polyprenyltransferase